MKARKTKSGKWTVCVFDYTDDNGKQHNRRFTADTKLECEKKAMLFRATGSQRNDIKVYDLVKRAIEIKGPTLSPYTATQYRSILENWIKPHRISWMRMSQLNNAIVQDWIGYITKGHSPKTVKNMYGVLTSCLQLFGEVNFKVRLPQKTRPAVYIPSTDEIMKLVDYIQYDRDLLIAVLLGAFSGMRRGEICALTADDIQGNVISVTKAYALDRGRWIIKPPKTTGSERTVLVSDHLAGMLPKEGCVIGINPGQVSCRFQRAVKNSGMDRHFTFHSLRHYHATMMHTAGVSDITIQSEHGWKSASTMKNIYWGNIESEKKRQMDLYNNSVSELLKNGEWGRK